MKVIDNENSVADTRPKVYTQADFTVTHTDLSSTPRTGGVFNSRLTPFEDSKGNWYLRGTVNHNQWTTGSATEGLITISGVSFDTTQRWAIAGSNNSRSPVGGWVSSSDTLRWTWDLVLSGSTGGSDNRVGLLLVDLPLTEKPTWAI